MASNHLNIVVTTRCLNGIEYIDRFVRGYDFANQIIVSDGGSDDGSIEKWMEYYPKVRVFQYDDVTFIDGYKWNPDNNHIQHAIDRALEYNPTWLILDDLDDVPNHLLRKDARELLESTSVPQMNAFRLYLWGDKEYFPYMNRNFDGQFRSLWAWQPDRIHIQSDLSVKHGTMVGMMNEPANLSIPYVLLHKSWHPDTIQQKIDRYNAIGLPMNHPLEFAGIPEVLPEWAHE